VHPSEEDEFLFEDGPEDGPEEEEVDHLGELAALGWRRAETSFPAQEDAQDVQDEDPVARRLRREVGIFKGRGWWSDAVGNPTPRALTAQDLFEAGPPSGDGGGEDAIPWPATPEEMPDRLRRAISSLQAGARRFWDPGLSDWYERLGKYPHDPEKLCKDAFLHAKLWADEATGEQIWALVALRDGWYVPDGAIKEAVWRRATTGRSPWAEPELLPDTAATPPEDASEPGE